MDEMIDEFDGVFFDKDTAGMITGEKEYGDIEDFDNAFSDVMDTQEHRLNLYAINGLSLGLMAGLSDVVQDEFAGGIWHTSPDDRVCDGCAALDGRWMSFDEYDLLYGNNAMAIVGVVSCLNLR
jgi:hypothetical protein